jgi:hypothetical protein
MEIARYNEVEKNDNYHISTNSFSKTGADGNIYAIIHERDGYYLKAGINESDLDYVSGFMNKKRDRFKSYGAALKRMNLIFKPLNEQYNEGVGDGMYEEDEMEEQEKFVLNVPDEGGDEEVDMDVDMEAGDEEMDMDVDMEDDMGDEEMDMDVDMEVGDDEEGEEDEMEGFMKPIQKLTGKLGQKLRDVEEELGSADIKYVINSVISAVDLDNLDEEDLEDILDRLEDEETEYGDEEAIDDIDMGDEDMDMDIEIDGEEEVEGDEDVELEDEEEVMESLKNRVSNILESYIEKREAKSNPKEYLKNRLNVIKDKKKLKIQYETVEQEFGTEKILKENKEFKFFGKTKKNNIVLKSANREILINSSGVVI